MCGIFAYVGKQNNAAELVFTGLKSLEYRGYDSWGIATKIKNRFIIEKHVGKIGNANLNSELSTSNSSLAMGHTRWGTHGKITVNNAHPHLDCTKQIAVVHNGIIENFSQIQKELTKKGHLFISETDTEVIPHLIEEYAKQNTLALAVQKAFNRLQGLNAIVVLLPSEIIAAKTGSPLVIGRGKNAFYIASDAAGIIAYTRKLLFLKDNEMAILGNDLQLLSLPEGKKIIPHFETIDWKIEDVNKGSFTHFMLKEIYEQPKVVRNIAENYTGQIKELSETIQQARGTFFIGAGTAYHACLSGAYLFSQIAKHHVNTAVASEFNYLLDFINNRSLIIALSQSGETIDVVEPVNIAKHKGAKIVALTNVLGSTIYRMADKKILLGAGPEKAVASTKAYIAKLALLLSLSYAMIGRLDEVKTVLLSAASEMEKMIEKRYIEKIKKLADLLYKSEHMYTVGRGLSFGSALEAALKIKEVSYIHAEGLAGGELKHGTIALISKGTPCIVFAPKDETFEAMISNATEIKARGGLIIGISPENASVFDHWIKIKDVQKATVITQIVPAQLLAYFLAVKRGFDPDKPRNLAKSVTVK